VHVSPDNWAKSPEIRGGEEITIRVVIFKDDDLWGAQCLEYDIGAQAGDLDTLDDRLAVAIHAELIESLQRNGEPFGGIEKAPERFQNMWEHRSRSAALPPVRQTVQDRSMNLDRAFAA